MSVGTVVEFVAAADVEIELNAARPSKSECIVIGMNYFQACENDKAMDEMLDTYGPVLVRRSLKAFANYAKRTNQGDVAKFAEGLRDDIKVVNASVAV
jgi:hypothetical protein